MAGTKKKTVQKAVSTGKRPAKKTRGKAAPRKAAPKLAAPARAKKKTTAKTPSLFAKAIKEVTSLFTGPAKKAPNREYGEGNYEASRRFRAGEEAFVKTNRSKIPALGKAAQAALDGPEGDALRAAEASAAGHAAGKKT